MTPDDRAAITELLTRYNYAFDSYDADAWASCFAPNGSFEGRRGTAIGHAALKEYVVAASERGIALRHMNGNLLIENGQTPDTAVARSYLISWRVEKGGPTFNPTALQRDQLVRIGNDWKIQHRALTFDEPPAE